MKLRAYKELYFDGSRLATRHLAGLAKRPDREWGIEVASRKLQSLIEQGRPFMLRPTEDNPRPEPQPYDKLPYYKQPPNIEAVMEPEDGLIPAHITELGQWREWDSSWYRQVNYANDFRASYFRDDYIQIVMGIITGDNYYYISPDGHKLYIRMNKSGEVLAVVMARTDFDQLVKEVKGD